jgi:hypothetical protein
LARAGIRQRAKHARQHPSSRSRSSAPHHRHHAARPRASVQSHDILYKMSRDILYTPARAQRAPRSSY